jgi:hypothetical protein
MPWMSPGMVLSCFVAYNAVIRDVAAERGLVLADGEDAIPPDDEHFADSVHFRDAGCVLQSERILRALDGARSAQLRWLEQRDQDAMANGARPIR